MKITDLVGARVLEQNDTLLLQEQPCLLRKEEVGTFDDVLEVWLAITVDQVGNVGDVDSFWSTTTWDKQVGLDSEVEVVSEICTVWNDLSS